MDFSLTEDQIELQKWAHEFAEKEIYTIFEGTSEIQRMVIARALLAD